MKPPFKITGRASQKQRLSPHLSHGAKSNERFCERIPTREKPWKCR